MSFIVVFKPDDNTRQLLDDGVLTLRFNNSLTAVQQTTTTIHAIHFIYLTLMTLNQITPCWIRIEIDFIKCLNGNANHAMTTRLSSRSRSHGKFFCYICAIMALLLLLTGST